MKVTVNLSKHSPGAPCLSQEQPGDELGSELCLELFIKIKLTNKNTQQSLHASKNSQVDQKILDQVRKDLMKITDMHRKKKELADNMGSLLDR